MKFRKYPFQPFAICCRSHLFSETTISLRYSLEAKWSISFDIYLPHLICTSVFDQGHPWTSELQSKLAFYRIVFLNALRENTDVSPGSVLDWFRKLVFSSGFLPFCHQKNAFLNSLILMQLNHFCEHSKTYLSPEAKLIGAEATATPRWNRKSRLGLRESLKLPRENEKNAGSLLNEAFFAHGQHFPIL